MPRQNRVTPLGEVIATPERGLVYANRGCLHDGSGRIRDRYPTRRWIACQLDFRGRRRTPLMAPGKFTELFFLDEATALAAGHRPCGECRYRDYEQPDGDVGASSTPASAAPTRSTSSSTPSAATRDTKQRRFHEPRFDELPDGAFVMLDEASPTWCSARSCSAGRRRATRRGDRDRPAGGARP